MHLFQATQLSTDGFVEMSDLGLEVLSDLLKALQPSMVAEVSNRAISINFCLCLPHPIDPKSPAVVKLIEDPNPTGNQLQNLHFLDLVPLLLALGQGLIRGQLIYILLDFLALLRQKVLEDVINAVIVKVNIVLFSIVEEANQPSHVIVTDLLILDLFGKASHAQWMLKFQLKVALSSLVSVNLLVQLAGLDDCSVVTQVEAVLLLEFVQAGDVDERHLMCVILLQANMIK